MRRDEFELLGLDELMALRSAVEDQERGLDDRAARAAVLSGLIARGAATNQELIAQVFPSLDTMPEAQTDLEYANQVLAVFGAAPLKPKE